MAVRLFKYGSLVVAVGGLAILLLVAIRSEVPVVEIGALAGTMNWAYVRIEGNVARQPTYDPVARTLRFWVQDGTGEIMVTAYRSEAETLLAEDMVPLMGDRVAVEGTLRIREDFEYLILDVPQNIEIQANEPVEVSIADAASSPLYQKVTVQGMVRGEREPYEGLQILTLRDATGEIDVTLATEAILLGGDLPDLSVGQSVQVTGAMDQYRAIPQISVGRGGDLVVLDKSVTIAPLRRCGQLSSGDVENMVQVEGIVTKVDPFSTGVKLTLDDGSGVVTLLLWQDLYASLIDLVSLVPGAMLRAQGKVAQYQGQLEVIPEVPSDVTVLAVSQRPVAERQLGELSADDLGRVVRVDGVLRSLRSFSAGVKGLLDDGTGTVTLLLWQEVYDGLPDEAQLVPGAVLRIEGDLREYKGDLEIVPYSAADVAVEGVIALPMEERAIGQVTADDVGQTVLLVGEVAEIAAFSRGVKCSLADDTGTITLLLWQNIYDHLAEPDQLAVGAWVVVRGEVDEYLGDLEIVPQVPADVEVIDAAEVAMSAPPAVSEPKVEPEVPSEAGGGSSASPSDQSPQATALPTPLPTSPATATPSVEVRTIGAISAADVGSTYTIVQANITELSYFSRGVKYTVTDGSGNLTLLLWQNVLEEIPDRYDLIPGSQVRLTGDIDEYLGDLEIIPRRGEQVVLLAPGERLPTEGRSVNNITPSDEGRVFTVEGTVSRTESSDWLRVWIDDGTGEILVFVPERVVPYLRPGIGAGLQLRVTGEVDIYQSVVEIIPLAAADVEVP